MQPDRKRISPSRTKRGTVPSDAVVLVSNMEFTTMPNAASPKVSTTPEIMMMRKAREDRRAGQEQGDQNYQPDR